MHRAPTNSAALLRAHRLATAASLLPEAHAEPCLTTGVGAIDGALPGNGLPRGLHEIAAPSGDPAGYGFALMLLRQRAGRILWCRPLPGRRGARPYGPGLIELGIEPGRLIFVEADKPVDLLWAMEEGLRTRGLAAVLGEVTPDFIHSRRLQLAAESADMAALLLPPATQAPAPKAPVPNDGAAGPASAAVTRWRVCSIPSEDRSGGPGRPRWRLELWRCRGGGQPQDWTVEWNDAAVSLDLVSPLSDRPLAAATG